VLAPVATPRDMVTKLHAEIVKRLRANDMRQPYFVGWWRCCRQHARGFRRSQSQGYCAMGKSNEALSHKSGYV
jgi:hypothetical protein